MKYVFLLLSVVLPTTLMGQARIVLNGAFINIENNAYLVVDNPAPNAFTRTVNGGHVISENENDIIRWNIGNTNGAYIIPWGFSTTDYIPLVFNTSGATGSGGQIDFATYRTPTWRNSDYLPVGVAHVGGLGDYPGIDISNYVIDRFWLIRMMNYTAKPAMSNVQFHYRDIEHSVASNTITESELVAQRYNPTIQDWGPVYFGSANTTQNRVEAAAIPSPQIYDWWTLAMSTFPLPVELLSFSGEAGDNEVFLHWVTATEYNNDYYIVERSKDGVHFEFVANIDAAGNSSVELQYNTIDPQPYEGISYYRLKQVDFDGSSAYSNVISVEFKKGNLGKPLLSLYPNPASTILQIQYNGTLNGKFSFQVFDASGRLMMDNILQNQLEDGLWSMDVSRLAQGSYFIRFSGHEAETSVFKFVKQ